MNSSFPFGHLLLRRRRDVVVDLIPVVRAGAFEMAVGRIGEDQVLTTVGGVGLQVRGRVVDVEVGVDADLVLEEAEILVRHMVLLEPLDGLGDRERVQSPHVEAVGDDPDVDPFRGELPQGVRGARYRGRSGRCPSASRPSGACSRTGVRRPSAVPTPRTRS